jgi:hypothetical protein
MMGEFFMAPPALAAFSSAHDAAATAVSTAAAVNSQAILAEAMAALGPIGASYLAAFAPALGNHLQAGSQLGVLHAAVSGATNTWTSAIAAADNA